MSLKEELKKLQEQLLEDSQSVVPRAPFERFFISYDPDVGIGQYALGGEKDESGNWTDPPLLIGKSADVIFLKEYGQYVYFDPQLEKVTVKSNIFPKWKAKDAVDLYTDKPIAELKEIYPGIRYTQVTLILVNINRWVPAIWYMKGSTIKAYLDIIRENKLKPEDYIGCKIFRLGIQKNKKGTVIYYTPTLEKLMEPSDKDAKTLLSLIPEATEKFKKYVDEYNGIRYPEPMQEENGEGEGIWDEEADAE